MTRADSVIVRWAKADHYEGSGGKELFVKNTGIRSKEQARKLAREIKAVVNATVVTKAYQGEVWGYAQQPYGGWRIGDKMGGDVITGFTMTMGEDGSTVVPVLSDVDVLRAGALDRKLTRLANGDASQWSLPASPKREDTENKDGGVTGWSYGGKLRHNTMSPLGRMRRTCIFAWLDVAVRQPSDETDGADVYITAYTLNRKGQNQTGIANIGIPAGEHRSIVRVGEVVPSGSSLIFGLLLAGGDSEAEDYAPLDLTVTARGCFT